MIKLSEQHSKSEVLIFNWFFIGFVFGLRLKDRPKDKIQKTK